MLDKAEPSADLQLHSGTLPDGDKAPLEGRMVLWMSVCTITESHG
jgi:hypothetical protein